MFLKRVQKAISQGWQITLESIVILGFVSLIKPLHLFRVTGRRVILANVIQKEIFGRIQIQRESRRIENQDHKRLGIRVASEVLRLEI